MDLSHSVRLPIKDQVPADEYEEDEQAAFGPIGDGIEGEAAALDDLRSGVGRGSGGWSGGRVGGEGIGARGAGLGGLIERVCDWLGGRKCDVGECHFAVWADPRFDSGGRNFFCAD